MKLTIRDIFDDAVRTQGARTFLRHHDGTAWRELSYSVTRDRIVRTLAVLLKQGLDAGASDGYRARMAIMAENSPEWIVAYLAATGCGFVVVPVDPKLASPEARHVLADSGVSLILADGRTFPSLDAAGVAAPRLDMEGLDGMRTGLTEAEVAAAERFWTDRRPDADDLASIVYTSGTTGRPKGAMLSHGNFTSSVDMTFSRVMFYGTDHFLLVLPLFHVFAFTMSFLLPLRKQAEISFARSVRSVAADMAELKPTVLMSVPLLTSLLYERARPVLAQLRLLGVGGAPIAGDLLKGLLETIDVVVEGYGITECSPGVAFPDERRYVPGTVGRPLDGMDWRIVSVDETGAGELYVKGPNVTQGYWKNPEETAKAFDADGFYRTGDIVRADTEGNLTICGRTKALIVNREGKNIYPEEVERVIARCPSVADVIVVGYHLGDEPGEHVGAIVVPDVEALQAAGRIGGEDEMSEIVRTEIRDACHAALAEYKWPRKVSVRFAPLEHTPSMKVKRFLYARSLDE